MTRDEYRATGAKLTAKRGSELPHAKLTEDDAVAIRKLHARKQRAIARLNERYSAAGIAKRYGVHVRTVERILQRTGWVHTLRGGE